jgi:hypothetical protein
MAFCGRRRTYRDAVQFWFGYWVGEYYEEAAKKPNKQSELNATFVFR